MVLDLVVLDMSDHPPAATNSGSEVELYTNGKLVDKVRPGRERRRLKAAGPFLLFVRKIAIGKRVMGFLKPLVAILAVLLGILILNSLIETYRWDQRIVEDMNKQGFQLISQTKGSAPIVPWTLFYPYVTHITLVHPDSVKPFKNFIAADVISFNGMNWAESSLGPESCSSIAPQSWLRILPISRTIRNPNFQAGRRAGEKMVV